MLEPGSIKAQGLWMIGSRMITTAVDANSFHKLSNWDDFNHKRTVAQRLLRLRVVWRTIGRQVETTANRGLYIGVSAK